MKKIAYLILITFFYACGGESENSDNVSGTKEDSLSTSQFDGEEPALVVDTTILRSYDSNFISSRLTTLGNQIGVDTSLYLSVPLGLSQTSPNDSVHFGLNIPQNKYINKVEVAHAHNNSNDTALYYYIYLQDASSTPKNRELSFFYLPTNYHEFRNCMNVTGKVIYNSGVVEATKSNVNNFVPSVSKIDLGLIDSVRVNNNARTPVPYNIGNYEDYEILAHAPDQNSYPQQSGTARADFLLAIPAGKEVDSVYIVNQTVQSEVYRTYEFILKNNPTKGKRMEHFQYDVTYNDFQASQYFLALVYEGDTEKKKKVLKTNTDGDPAKGL